MLKPTRRSSNDRGTRAQLLIRIPGRIPIHLDLPIPRIPVRMYNALRHARPVFLDPSIARRAPRRLLLAAILSRNVVVVPQLTQEVIPSV